MIIEASLEDILKEYLTKLLIPITQADPELLANYILALLKNHKSNEELQQKCEAELETFLHQETKPFIESLFSVLKDINNPPLMKEKLRRLIEADDEDSQEIIEGSSPNFSNQLPSQPPQKTEEERTEKSSPDSSDKSNTSRKRQRSPSNSNHREENNNHLITNNSNNHKREGTPERIVISSEDKHRTVIRDRSFHEKKPDVEEDLLENISESSESPRRKEDEGSSRREETTSNMENRRRFKQSNTTPSQPQQIRSSRKGAFDGNREKRQKCFNYFEHGVCERGDTCPYEHGQDRLVMDLQEFDNNFRVRGRRSIRGNRGRQFGPGQSMGGKQQRGLGDSRFSSISSDASTGGGTQGSQVTVNGSGNEPEDENVNVDLLYRQKMKNTSIEEETHDETQSPQENKEARERKKQEYKILQKKLKESQSTSLTVMTIPYPLNTIGKLSEHFSKFGHIINIEVLQSQKKAVIKFSSHLEALRAIKSPEAVMGNRFIKVFWTADEEDLAEVKKAEADKQKSQEEASKFLEEKKKKKIEAAKEAKRVREELQSKRLEQIREKQKMVTKLLLKAKKPHITPQVSAQIMSQVDNTIQSIKTDLTILNPPPAAKPVTPTPSPSTKRPKGSLKPTKEQLDRDLDEVKRMHDDEKDYIMIKLESLQKEAKLLGITETNTPTVPSIPGGSRRGGRGGRGRMGRGLWGVNSRGRRGRSWNRNLSSMSLDNRTTAFRLSNLPQGNLNTDLLKEHFSQFGQVMDVRIEGMNAIIKMDTRSNAEQSIKKGSVINSHQAIVSWVTEIPEDLTEPHGTEDEDPMEEAPVVEEYFHKEEEGPIEGSDSDNDDQ